MAYPGEATHQKIYALLLDDEFKTAALMAPDETDFVRDYIKTMGITVDIKGITPATTHVGPGMRKIDWNLPGDEAHPHNTYYYL